MAISDVSICNSALIKLGAERISSLTDDNKRARLCNEQYAKIRDDFLRAHPWNFAVARKELGLSATFTPAFEYDYAFVIPSDVLRILAVDFNLGPAIGEIPWAVEVDDTGVKHLVTNSSTAKIKYIKRVLEARFDDNFAELLSTKLAADLAYAITQSTSIAELLDKKFREKMREVRSLDAMEGSVPTVEADEWFLARHSGLGAGVT